VHFAERLQAILEIDHCCQPLQLEVKPTQNVNLPPHFKNFVEANVRDGRFGNVSEVVRAGFRLLEHEQAVQKLKIQRLREAAKSGIDDVAAGRFTDFSASDISSHLEKISTYECAAKNS
jgi:antitoxin ParD1/3/4